MHYTSIENIHKVIDPLFLDDLKNELKEIQQITVQRTKDKKLRDFQTKLANLRWLDPASGSGNFLPPGPGGEFPFGKSFYRLGTQCPQL